MGDSDLPGPEEYVYVLCDGTSMWPAIRPGDMLRGHRATLGRVPTGSIVLVDANGGEGKGGSRIHRLTRKIRSASRARGLAITAGDRTGPDEPVPLESECVKLVDVLRRGRWKRLTSRKPSAILRSIPDWTIRLATGLLRVLRKPPGTRRNG